MEYVTAPLASGLHKLGLTATSPPTPFGGPEWLDESRHPIRHRALTEKITTFAQLRDVCYPTMPAATKATLAEHGIALPILANACNVIVETHAMLETDKCYDGTPDFDFFGRVLPFIQARARDAASLFPTGTFPQIPALVNAEVVLTQEQCVCVQAAAFLGFSPVAAPTRSAAGNYGDLCWIPLLFQSASGYSANRASNMSVAVNRVACQLNYFYHLEKSFAEYHRGLKQVDAFAEHYYGFNPNPSGTPPTAGVGVAQFLDTTPVKFERIVLHEAQAGLLRWATADDVRVLVCPPPGDCESSDGPNSAVTPPTAETQRPYNRDGHVLPYERPGETQQDSTPNTANNLPPLGIKISSKLRVEDARPPAGYSSNTIAQVDFANKQIHIGRIIPSCTQEEVLFSIRPDLMLLLPMMETLKSNEAVLVYGAQRFSNYSGYLDTFHLTGDYESSATLLARAEAKTDSDRVDSVKEKMKGTHSTHRVDEKEEDGEPEQVAQGRQNARKSTTPQCFSVSQMLQKSERWKQSQSMNSSTSTKKEGEGIDNVAQDAQSPSTTVPVVEQAPDNLPPTIVIDAIVNRGTQYTPAMLLRDLNKCYAGFHKLPDAIPFISTGNWGCGAFFGDPTLKLLQQLMAAAMCPQRKFLYYSTFGNPAQAKEFIKLCRLIQMKEVSVGQLYRWIAEYGTTQERPIAGQMFYNFILKKLRDL